MAKIKKEHLTNVRVDMGPDSHNFAVCCVVGGARFHTWAQIADVANSAGLNDRPSGVGSPFTYSYAGEGAIYKNSVAGLHKPGYFHTRTLSKAYGIGRDVFRAMMDIVLENDLIVSAWVEREFTRQLRLAEFAQARAEAESIHRLVENRTDMMSVLRLAAAIYAHKVPADMKAMDLLYEMQDRGLTDVDPAELLAKLEAV